MLVTFSWVPALTESYPLHKQLGPVGGGSGVLSGEITHFLYPLRFSTWGPVN